MAMPGFTKVVIGELENDVESSPMNTFLAVGDVDRDGLLDVVVSGRNGKMAWFRNPGPGHEREWVRYPVADVRNIEAGGLLADLTGEGYPAIIVGGDYRSNEIRWWENPGPRGGLWTERTIARLDFKFHDTALGDITGDGVTSLIFWNQGSGRAGANLYRVPLPRDPRVTPWPGVEQIAAGRMEDGQPEEGLCVADIDGDGRNELIAGTWWYKWVGGRCEGHQFARGVITTRLAAGDIDGDGRLEVVLSEGDPCIFGRPEGGKLAWYKPGADTHALWHEHVIEDHLMDAHSLQLGDVCGNGCLDIFVGEIGVKATFETHKPRLLLFENDGRAGFTRT